MSVALVTTLYGSLIANWLCNPTASKLKVNNSQEMMMKEITVEGILSIQAESACYRRETEIVPVPGGAE